MWYVYLLQNKYGKWHTGATNDAQKRILEHNSKKNQQSTGHHGKLFIAKFI